MKVSEYSIEEIQHVRAVYYIFNHLVKNMTYFAVCVMKVVKFNARVTEMLKCSLGHDVGCDIAS